MFFKVDSKAACSTPSILWTFIPEADLFMPKDNADYLPLVLRSTVANY